MKLDQETIDRLAAENKLGYFNSIKSLLAYRLNEQKGYFVFSRSPAGEGRIVSAVLKRGRVLVTVDDGGPPFRTFELKFELVEQFPKAPLGGTPVTREKALAGLGDPATWDAHAKAVYAEFEKKPS